MDFSKLNLEFSNMQNTINRYNEIIKIVNERIKDNLKIINKSEVKLKNAKDDIERDIIELYLDVIKGQNKFLNCLLEKDNKKEQIKKQTNS